MIEANKVKEKNEYRKLAVLSSWITAPHLKRPLNPEKLLDALYNEEEKEEKRKTTKEETERVISELENEFNLT